MEGIQSILQKLNNTAHTYEPMTPEEREKSHAEIFNDSEGHLNNDDGYQCDICHNKGLIMRAYQPYEGIWSTISSECRCMDVRRSIRRMKKSGLKDIISDYTFEKYIASSDWQRTLKEAAEAYAESPSGWFFIGGQSGAGKTHLCTAICRKFLLSGKSVKYMLWRDEIVKLKGSINEPEEYEKMMSEFKNIEILYIDDLFKTGKGADGNKQQPTAADINIAFEILNFRYNSPKLLTIISSECTVNDILDIDEATGGRIFEKAKAFSLKPDKAKNYRLKGATEL